MTSDQIDAVISQYLALGSRGAPPRSAHRARPADADHVGSAILQALLRAWPTDRLSVADRGLREGLLYAQMSRDGVLEE
jgi:exopolyphosphatase/guanosine-5'-triphosphate,3'-diphosphate pyrophosphatase